MMSPTTVLLLSSLALAVGALIPVQAATNAALSKSLGSVFYASLVLFGVGFAVVAAYLAVKRMAPPSFAAFQSAPGYGYLGGFIVASYVLSITYLAPRLGVGNAICFIVTGQIVSAVLIDHFGLFGADVQTINWPRSLGVVLMIAGLFLARRA
jgi:transporter family-2 protein